MIIHGMGKKYKFKIGIMAAINDEARRASEDIEQFHNAHPDADLSDHYYWDDVLDAETDGYV